MSETVSQYFHSEPRLPKYLQRGDVIEFEGCMALGLNGRMRQQFVVMNPGEFYPSPISAGKYRNVTAKPRGTAMRADFRPLQKALDAGVIRSDGFGAFEDSPMITAAIIKCTCGKTYRSVHEAAAEKLTVVGEPFRLPRWLEEERKSA